MLALLGVAIGTTALTGVQMISDGVYTLAATELVRMGKAEIRILPVTSGYVDGVRVPAPNPVRFSEPDAIALQQSLGREAAVLLVDSGGLLMRIGGKLHGVNVVAVFAPNATSVGDPLIAGTRPNFGKHTIDDFDAAYASFQLARLLVGKRFDVNRAIGQRIYIDPLTIRIVGVGDSITKGPRQLIWIHRADALRLRSPFEESLIIRPRTTNSGEEFSRLTSRAGRWLASQRPEWTQRVTISSPAAAALEGMRRRTELIRIILSVFCLVTTTVAAIGIGNIILASVLERIPEIGIRKAMGARFGDIFGQFMAESVLISVFGGAIGIIAGASAASLLAWFVRIRTAQDLVLRLEPEVIALGVSIALAAGVLAGTVPAVYAARLSPINALRRE